MEEERRRAWIAILLIAPIPSLNLLFSQFSGDGALAQAVFVLSKILLLAIPLWWYLKLEGNPISWSLPTQGGWGVATALGLGMGGVILAAWFIIGVRVIDVEEIRTTWGIFGMTDWRILLMACLYWIFLNSVLEEFVFRWFITTRAETVFGDSGIVKPILLSATVFTIHHIIVLAFSVVWWVVVLGTTAIFVSGLLFSWLYLRYRSVWVVWLCHAIADIGLFIVIAIIMLG
jgi:membrane protease YdiL (CAAX protease family)